MGIGGLEKEGGNPKLTERVRGQPLPLGLEEQRTQVGIVRIQELSGRTLTFLGPRHEEGPLVVASPTGAQQRSCIKLRERAGSGTTEGCD